MKKITVLIAYETIRPTVLENIISRDLMGWYGWKDGGGDFFEFWVVCREEDASAVERKLTQYV